MDFQGFIEGIEKNRRPWLFFPDVEKAQKGKGRGHWGHKGRPGKVGGSLPNGAGKQILTGKDVVAVARKLFPGRQPKNIVLDRDYGSEQTGGSYQWTNDTVALNKKRSAALRKYIETGEKTPETIRAVHALGHEIYHSRSPAAVPEQGEKRRYFEEGLVEHKTRQRMRRLFPGVKYVASYGMEAKAMQWMSGTFGASAIDKMWSKRSEKQRRYLANKYLRPWLRDLLISKGSSPVRAKYIVRNLRQPYKILYRSDFKTFEKLSLKGIEQTLRVVRDYGVPIEPQKI